MQANIDAELQREQRQRDEATARRIEAARIPVRFADKKLADYRPNCDGARRALEVANDYVQNFKGNLTEGRCLTFLGKAGTGKTHLATSITTAVAQGGWSSRYITALELVRELRASWGGRRVAAWDGFTRIETETDVLERFCQYSLLVIDEVGVQFGSDAELAQLSEVLDLRYRQMKPTLVISNCAPGELKRYLGDRGVDRLRENSGIVVVFDWPSHRGEASRGAGDAGVTQTTTPATIGEIRPCATGAQGIPVRGGEVDG